MTHDSFELREQALSSQSKRLIAERVFGTDQLPDLRPYLRYYTRQCRQITSVAMMDGQVFPLTSHVEVLDIVAEIRSRTSHSAIIERLVGRYGTSVSPEVLQNSVDLALRIMLMLDVGTFANVYTGRDVIAWTNGTIDDFLGEIPIFCGCPELSCEGVKLESTFNVLSLERFAGLDVQLTTNLADHLVFREDMKVVTIFHHAAFLQRQKGLNSVFPPGFVEETLNTIALLLPKGNKKIERWYRRKENADELDLASLRCGAVIRRIDQYRFWRDRLVQLKEAFDDTRPRTLSQWWNDRRDGVQWYTFWIAIFFTIFFGLVQSIEGAIQVYQSYKPSSS